MPIPLRSRIVAAVVGFNSASLHLILGPMQPKAVVALKVCASAKPQKPKEGNCGCLPKCMSDFKVRNAL